MAWSVADWTVNPDWHALANINDYQKAVNERKLAIGQAADALKVVGDDVQGAAFWNAMQTWVENNLTGFVVSHDAGVPRAAAYYDNAATIDTYANIAAVFSAANLGTATWRAYTVHPNDAGANQARKIQAGDIIGPWLFEDLQKCLNVLVWTRHTATWGARGENNYRLGWSSTEEASWEDAKTLAEVGYDSGTSSIPAAPFAITRGADGVGTYWAYLARIYSYGYLANLPNPCKRAVEWYAYANKWADTWDANGDDVIEDKWSLYCTDDPAATALELYSGVILGDNTLAKPTWCGPPASGTSGRGYTIGVNGHVAVVRWNVTDGFSYK